MTGRALSLHDVKCGFGRVLGRVKEGDSGKRPNRFARLQTNSGTGLGCGVVEHVAASRAVR